MYRSIDDMWTDMVSDLLRYGEVEDSRDGGTRELIGYHGELDASEQRTFLQNERRALSPVYAAAEVIWYLSGRDEVAPMRRYAPKYAKFAEENGRAHGAYGPRVMPQLPRLVETIKNAPRTRQGVTVIWKSDDLECAVVEGTKKDVPCTLAMQFLLRRGRLHLIVTMRSNDVWLGTPYDVFAFTCFQRLIAAHLDAQVGQYVHDVGSLHLYDRNLVAADEAVRQHKWRPDSHLWKLDDTLSTAMIAVSCEAMTRVHGVAPTGHDALGTMLRDLTSLCAWHCGIDTMTVQSPSLRQGLARLKERRRVPGDIDGESG